MIQALLLAAALAAPSNTVDLDRMHVIYDAAKEVCPVAYRTSKSGDEFITNVTQTADHLNYQPQERVLLMTFCTVYAQGVEAGVNAAQAQAQQAQPPAQQPSSNTQTPSTSAPSTGTATDPTPTPMVATPPAATQPTATPPPASSATPQTNGESPAPVQGN